MKREIHLFNYCFCVFQQEPKKVHHSWKCFLYLLKNSSKNNGTWKTTRTPINQNNDLIRNPRTISQFRTAHSIIPRTLKGALVINCWQNQSSHHWNSPKNLFWSHLKYLKLYNLPEGLQRLLQHHRDPEAVQDCLEDHSNTLKEAFCYFKNQAEHSVVPLDKKSILWTFKESHNLKYPQPQILSRSPGTP